MVAPLGIGVIALAGRFGGPVVALLIGAQLLATFILVVGLMLHGFRWPLVATVALAAGALLALLGSERLGADAGEGTRFGRATGSTGNDLRGEDLTGRDFTGRQLPGGRLDAVQAAGASFRDSNLAAAELVAADLIGTDLAGADLRGADLRGAQLRGANLTGACLRGTDLRGADLTGVIAAGADVTGAFLPENAARQAAVWVTGEADPAACATK